MQQIDTFHVGSFRGLTDVTLEGAGQVNLIVGGNNSGKTSLLEAIAVYAAPLDVAEWASVARMREVRGAPFIMHAGLSSTDAIRWLFPQREATDWERGARELLLSGDGKFNVRSLKAACTPIRGIPPEPRYSQRKNITEDELIEEDGWHLSIDMRAEISGTHLNNQLGIDLLEDATDGKEHVKLEMDVWGASGLRYNPQNSAPRLKCVTLSPYSHRNQPLTMRMLSRIISSGEKSDLIGLLQGVDANIKDLEILTEGGGRPLITALLADGRRVPVSVLGDGFRRALAIAIAMNQVKGGVLLIDEVETAMHVSALDTLFPWLVRLAAAQNVQIFATTHSLEAIQAITAAAVRVGSECLTAYHIPNRNEKGAKPRRYTSGMLTRVVRDRGLDIR